MVDFEILPGLPPYGPMAEGFSASGQGMHREGLVVRFMPLSAEAWVGNFQGGPASDCNQVLGHPNGREVIVIAGGQGYIVDVCARKCLGTFGGIVNSVFEVRDQNLVIFGNGL